MANDTSYFMVFEDVASGIDRRDYIRRYQSGEARSATDTCPQAESAEDRDRLQESQAPVVPTLDPLEHMTTWGAGEREHIEQAKSVVLENFAQEYPLLPREKIVDATVHVLSSAWRDYPAGTVVYRRRTNLGTIVFGVADLQLDIASGKTIYATPPDPAPEAAAAAVPGATDQDQIWETIVQSGLTLATFAGFALGPYGLILSGGAATLQAVFHQWFASRQRPNLVVDIGKMIEQVELTLKLEDAAATIKTDYQWLAAYYNENWLKDTSPLSDSEYKEFKSDLDQKLAADTGLVQTVNLLMEPSYEEKGLPLFLLGASLVLTFHKLQTIIHSSERQVVDTMAYNALMQTLASYIDYAYGTPKERARSGTAGVIGGIDHKIEQRMSRISTEVFRDQTCQAVCAGASCHAKCSKAWAFKDGKHKYDFYDSFHSKHCKRKRHEHQDKAQQHLAAHRAAVLAQQQQSYYQGTTKSVHATVDNWIKMQKNFAALAPSRTD